MTDPKTTITMATATPGGGFPLYGGVVAETVNTVDPSLVVECRNTKGSTENVPLLVAREVDLGLACTGEVAIEPFAAKTGLTILAAMYSTAGMLVVRGDSPARSIADLKGQPVAFGAAGSGLVILARYVLDGIGLDPERDFTAIYLDRAGDGPAMVLDGRAAALWGGGIGWPGFALAVAGAGGRFIAPDAGRGRAHPRQARLPEAADRVGRRLSRPGRGDPLSRLVGLHPRAAGPARRHRLPLRPRLAPGRGAPRRKARPGEGNDSRQYRRRGARPGADPSRRRAVSAGDRGPADG